MSSAHLDLSARTPSGWPWITVMDGTIDGQAGTLWLGSWGESFSIRGEDVEFDGATAHVKQWPDWFNDSWTVEFGIIGATSTVSMEGGDADLVGEMFYLTGATAITSWQAYADIPTLGAASVALYGATSGFIVASNAATFTAASNLALSGATAALTATAPAGNAVVPVSGALGDPLLMPIPITYFGLTSPNVQAFYPDLYNSTVEVGEVEVGALQATVWYSILSDTDLIIDVSYSGAVTSMTLFEGEPTVSTPYVGFFSVSANVLYYLRAGAEVPNGVAEFILVASPVASNATIGAGTVDHTPTTITINGGGFPANSPITVSLSGGVVATVQSDSSGILVPTDVLIMGSLNAGTYSITGQSGSTIAIGTFTVLNNPLPPLSSTPDAPTTIPTGSRWMLRDPYTTGHIPDFTFVTNPSEMSSPYAPMNLTTDVTTAGTSHIWEGGLRATEWSFSGILETSDEFNSLAAYRKIGRRFHLRDHRNRIWTVTFTNLDVQPLRTYPALMRGMTPGAALHQAPWAHKYTVSALIYSGPVDAV